MFNYLLSTFQARCPRCREGYIYRSPFRYTFSKKNMDMHAECPVCKQPTEIEVGFYYGTGYVSYALTIAISVATFIAWKVLFGLSFNIDDNRIFYWLGANIILLILMQPIIMRYARVLWLSWFVSYDPQWREHEVEQPERVNKEQANNW
ncbi:MAG: DUF983 domain-containing protein [Chitinophagaceae bacterium]|nr:DUF983 domain-containing protein [Chitinophagaceae bacterium]